MKSWTVRAIGDIAQVFDGPHATPKKTEHGPWFLSISSLDQGRLRLSESAHVSEEDFNNWTRRVTPRPGDLLFSYETRLGDAALMPEGLRACLGRRMGLLRPTKDEVDPRFLLYAYLAPEFQTTIQARKIHGATVDRIPLVELPSWQIRLPTEIREQQAIAAVLGALDDKIALNERIVATTEALQAARADALFEETKEEHKLAEIIDLKYGKALRASERTPGQVPVYGSNGVSGSHSVALSRGPGIIIGRKGANAGSVSWSQQDFWVIDTAFYVQSKKSNYPFEFLYSLLQRVDFRGLVGDSAIPGLNRDQALSVLVRLPGTDRMNQFASDSTSIYSRVQSAQNESRVLGELRDTLLPDLMSGRLRIRDAERIVEDAI